MLQEDAALTSVDNYAPSSPSRSSTADATEAAAAVTPHPGTRLRGPGALNKNSSPGWQGKPKTGKPPICHTCYEVGHYKPDCPLEIPPTSDQQAVIKFTTIVDKNWQSLTPNQREWFINNGKSPSAVAINNFKLFLQAAEEKAVHATENPVEPNPPQPEPISADAVLNISERPFGLPKHLTFAAYIQDPICKLSLFNYKVNASIGPSVDSWFPLPTAFTVLPKIKFIM